MENEGILLTGATGQFGQSLLPKLLASGRQVYCIVREKMGLSSEQRLKHLGCKRLVVIPWDITLPQAGTTEEIIRGLRGRIRKVVHCAALTKFDEQYREQLFAINIDGTKRMIELAETIGAEFYYISTAYIAGDSQRFLETDFDVEQRFRNAYEESKFAAEKEVRTWGKERSGRFSIIRLGILIGDESDGVTKKFDTCYGFFLAVVAIRDYLRKRYSLNLSEQVYLPVHFDCSETSTINLIPTNWVADMSAGIINLPCQNKTFHVVNPRPPRAKNVITACLSLLDIYGYSVGDKTSKITEGTFEHFPKKIEKALLRYQPYVTHEANFGHCEVLRENLGETFREPRLIDAEFLATLIQYAEAAKWGKVNEKTKFK